MNASNMGYILTIGFGEYLNDQKIQSEALALKRQRLHQLKISFHGAKKWPRGKKETWRRFLEDLPICAEDRDTFISMYLMGYSKRKLCDYPVYEKEIDRRVDRVLDEIGKAALGMEWCYPWLDNYLGGFASSYCRCERLAKYSGEFNAIAESSV